MPLFEDSWKRLNRARMHAQAFMDEFNKLFDNCNTILEQEDEQIWVARAVFGTNLENSLALELGEFFYQLRAALDAAVWEGITHLEGTIPITCENRVEFPICSNEKKFNQSVIHTLKFPQELRNWIGTIQPYSSEKNINDPDCGLSLTLQTLHDCARKDRHRKLHITTAVPERIEYEFLGLPADMKIDSIKPVSADFLKGENIFLRFGFKSVKGKLPPFQAKLATALLIDAAVNEIPKWSDGIFAVELKRFGMAAEQVINRFESTFAKLSSIDGIPIG